MTTFFVDSKIVVESKVETILKGSLDSITFRENSNYGQESLLEVYRQNIAGRCQQSFENNKFVEITQQSFALLPQVSFLPII